MQPRGLKRPHRLFPAALALAALAGAVAPAKADILSAVRQRGAVRCGAAARAGLADAGEDGRITGLAVDLCRAMTIAVLGPAGRTEFRLYDSARDYDAIRRGADDIAFLTADTVSEQALAPDIIAGPVVFIAELTAMMLPGEPGGLDGVTACFMAGSPAHQALEAWAGHSHAALVRIGFQELVELHDAFDARRCGVIAGEASELAEFRSEAAMRAGARILPAFGLMPVFAATPVADGRWAALAGWALAAIVQSEASPSPWRGDPPGVALGGLWPGWPEAVAATLGSYGAMTARNLGTGSKLGLLAGPNALWPEGLLLPPGPR